MSTETDADRWQRIAYWFLVLSYTAGSLAFAIFEVHTGLFSERFGYPPLFMYLVSASQIASALVLHIRRLALWSILVLTVISVGAIASHLMINSPLTALPSLAYTLIQIWYGVSVHRQYRNAAS